MSTTVDERVVEMRFDNKQFDKFIVNRQVKAQS